MECVPIPVSIEIDVGESTRHRNRDVVEVAFAFDFRLDCHQPPSKENMMMMTMLMLVIVMMLMMMNVTMAAMISLRSECLQTCRDHSPANKTRITSVMDGIGRMRCRKCLDGKLYSHRGTRLILQEPCVLHLVACRRRHHPHPHPHPHPLVPCVVASTGKNEYLHVRRQISLPTASHRPPRCSWRLSGRAL